VVDENRSWYRVSCFANNNKTDHVMLSTKQYKYPITNQSKS
jgi:thiamine pyrophosphokinase